MISKKLITIVLVSAGIAGCNTTTTQAQPVVDDAELIARGEQIFINQCEYCHGRGLEKGGTHRLRQRYKGAVTEYLQDRDNLTPEYIRTIIRQWSMGMAAIRPTEITDEELGWLIAYLIRNNSG